MCDARVQQHAIDSQFHGDRNVAGGTDSGIHDAFAFILDNFLEAMKLWCRLSSGGPQRDKQKREKERQELSALVATNLVRLSQLDGLTWEFYRDFALPKLLEQLLLKELKKLF